MNGENSRRNYFVVAILLFATVFGFYYFLPTFLDIIPDTTPFGSVQNRLEATSIFASTLLTLALFVVYWNMSDTQESQVDIMEGQKEITEKQNTLIEAEDRPLIDVDFITPGKVSEIDINGPENVVDKNGIEIGLVNVGNGIAILPRLVTELEFESEEYKSEKHVAKLRPVDLDSDNPFSDLQTSIPADNEIYHFAGSPSSKVWKKNEEIPGSIGEHLDVLFNSGVNDVSVKISIEVSSFIDNRHRFKVLKFDVNSKSFEDHLESNEPTLTDIFVMSLSDNAESFLEDGSFTRQYDDLSQMSDKSYMILVRSVESSIEKVAREQGIDVPDSVERIDERNNAETSEGENEGDI